MKLNALIPMILLAASSSVYAGIINPDCNVSKVATNAALKNTVGVSGRCDAEETAEQAKDRVEDRVDDAKDNVSDRVNDAKDNVSDKVDNQRDKVSNARDDISNAKDNVSDAKRNVKDRAENAKDTARRVKDEPVESALRHRLNNN